MKVLEGNGFAELIGKSKVRGFIINFHRVLVFKPAMNLYRRRFIRASVALFVLLGVAVGFGQQRRKAHKLRATGVLQLTTTASGKVTAQLTPVTILDQGRFEDASIYKAAPEPMALQSGVVYEAQKSGIPVGYITVGGATKGDIWMGSGKWQPVTQEAKKSDEPPPAAANPGDDRPRLHRGDSGSQATSSSPSPAPAAQSTPEPRSEPEPSEEDPNRPVLRRRTPKSSSSEAESPSATTTPTPGPQANASSPKPLVPEPGVQTFVAVSDAQPTDTRSFEFAWKPGEQEKAEEKMRRLALAQLPNENSQLTESSMTNVVIRSFDLDLSNDAVMVLTAEVPASYIAKGQKNAPGKFVSRYITLIARVDFEGNPQRLAVSVTDSSRLDVAPRLELIDAVDADGDGLAELLFREYSFDQKGFIVYGVARGTVTKVFEGATSPLP